MFLDPMIHGHRKQTVTLPDGTQVSLTPREKNNVGEVMGDVHIAFTDGTALDSRSPYEHASAYAEGFCAGYVAGTSRKAPDAQEEGPPVLRPAP